MTLSILRDDALTGTGEGFALRLSLPWIRSLPLASLTDLAVTVDGESAPVQVHLGDRTVEAGDLAGEDGWWFIQDRLMVGRRRMLHAGAHEVAVSFHLVIPYLQAGPDGPLILPFRAERTLHLGAPAPSPSVSRVVAWRMP